MAGMSRYSIILINYTSIILLSFCVISCPPFVTSELQNDVTSYKCNIRPIIGCKIFNSDQNVLHFFSHST